MPKQKHQHEQVMSLTFISSLKWRNNSKFVNQYNQRAEKLMAWFNKFHKVTDLKDLQHSDVWIPFVPPESPPDF